MERRGDRSNMNKIGIYINSSHRAETVKSTIQMPDSWKEFTVIAVPHDQVKAYEKHNDWPILGIPEDVPQFLPHQRQWIMENTEYKYVWMMDDDLKFRCRRTEGDVRLTNCKRKDLRMLLRTLEDTLHSERIPIVGVSTVFGNNRIETSYTECCRVTRCYCVNKRIFDKVGASFAVFEGFVMEDFHVILCFLENGYIDRCIYTFAQEDAGSNAKGGCSEYRTSKVQERSAFTLAELHPKSVTIQRKTTKGSWSGFEKDRTGKVMRTDVNIQWKKAYVPKRDKKSGIAGFLA